MGSRLETQLLPSHLIVSMMCESILEETNLKSLKASNKSINRRTRRSSATRPSLERVSKARSNHSPQVKNTHTRASRISGSLLYIKRHCIGMKPSSNLRFRPTGKRPQKPSLGPIPHKLCGVISITHNPGGFRHPEMSECYISPGSSDQGALF